MNNLKNQPQQTVITGILAPKFSCDLFDCVLAPFDLNENNKNTSSVSRSNPDQTPNNSQLSNEKSINNSSNDAIDLLNLI